MPRLLRWGTTKNLFCGAGWHDGLGGPCWGAGEEPEAALMHLPLSPQIYLSWKSGPGEVKHWKDMIARPRQPVAQWHQLKA